MAKFSKTTFLFNSQENGEPKLILANSEQLPPKDCDDPQNILARVHGGSFLFVAREKPPVLGYLLNSSWVNKYTAAVRIEINGSWNTNPHGLNHGSITYHYGYLRTASITNYRQQFQLKNTWVFDLWKEITNPQFLKMTNGEVSFIHGKEFYSIILLDGLLKGSTLRYLAVATLWAYWQDNDILIESRPSDLAVLNLSKHSKMSEDGEASEGKISKGAFATISKRAGVPKKINSLAMAP